MSLTYRYGVPSTDIDGTAATFTLSPADASIVLSANISATVDSLTISAKSASTGTAAEDDFAARAGGSTVVFFHDFSNDAEVDNFRWTASYGSGNDPQANGSDADLVRRITSDSVSGSGCLECYYTESSPNSCHWIRPLSALNGTGNGRGENDPAAQGAVTVRSWTPTDGGNQAASWSGDDYGPESTGTWEGNTFYHQFAMKISSSRSGSGVSGGKTNWYTRASTSLTDQEIVTSYSGTSDQFILYDSSEGTGTLITNELSSSNHIYDEWVTYLFRIVPGNENTSDGMVEVWRQRAADSTYTKIYQNLSWDFNYDDDIPTGKAWNAVYNSAYHNGQNPNADFYQRFDEHIFARDWIVERGINTTSLYAACLALDEGESADFSAGNQSTFNQASLEWQTDFYHDPIRHRVHLLAKQAGLTSAWRHQFFNIRTGSWTLVTDSLTGVAQYGHIYGNTGFNWYTGELYQVAGGVNTASNRDLFGYDPDDGTNGSWSEVVSNFDSGGNWNDTANGVAVHPQLYGPNKPGVIIDQQISTVFIDLSDDSDEDVSHSTNTYGDKYGCGVYWPEVNGAVMGGSNGDALALVRPNSGGTPTVTTLSDPPIRVSGESRENGAGFGSLHVHPGNPNKLLLLETVGNSAYEGTWTGSDISWSAIDDHPFDEAPRVLCSLRGGLGCMWAVGLDNSSSTNFSTLWRPPV